MLAGITGWSNRRSGEIIQPVTVERVREMYQQVVPESKWVGDRALRDLITELETMGLVETWIHSKDREGRVKQIETIFKPRWVKEAFEPFAEQTDRS